MMTREAVSTAITSEAPTVGAPGPAAAAITLRAALPAVTVFTDGGSPTVSGTCWVNG
jgi:hypothetical protein